MHIGLLLFRNIGNILGLIYIALCRLSNMNLRSKHNILPFYVCIKLLDKNVSRYKFFAGIAIEFTNHSAEKGIYFSEQAIQRQRKQK